jgi:phospholipid/cholesterol/gamma-HCH transport system substrate-binding protein
MSERTKNIAVGVTALAGLLGLALILMLFGYAPRIHEEGYEVKVRLPNAAGVGEGSHVTLSGIDVGRVRSMAFDPQRPGGVVAVMAVRSGTLVPRNVKARTTATILGGSPSLELAVPALPPGEKVAYLRTDGSEVIDGEYTTLTSDIQASLQRAEVQFEKTATELTRLGDQLAGDFHDLSTQWTAVGKNVKDLTDARTPGQVDAGQAAGNLSTVLARADANLRQLHTVLDGINQWTADQELRGNVRKTAANAAALTEHGQQAMTQVHALATRYLALADDLSGAVASLRQTLDQVRQGDGTAGKLLKDPQLYDNLNDSAVRLGQAIDEIKKLLEKIHTEGLPLKY